MITSPVETKPQPGSGKLFTTADGKNYVPVFVLVCSLFLLWGFCSGLLDNLNKHFQNTLHISKAQSGLVQCAFYMGYFIMALPAGMIARRFGYKGGIIVGLTLAAAGAFWFVHATAIDTYAAFLLGLFVLASGLACLETIANPYTTVLGPAASGATRINMAQTCNGVGWITGMLIGASIILSATTEVNTSNARLYIPYLGLGVVMAVLLVIFIVARIPDLRAEEESLKPVEQRMRARLLPAHLFVIGVALVVVCALLYFFISPVLDSVWALGDFNEQTLFPAKIALLVIAYIGAFFLVSKNWDLFRRKHFTMGVAAQFLYVAAQTGIFSFFINYAVANLVNLSDRHAGYLQTGAFALFASGRLVGSAVVGLTKPHKALAVYAVINTVMMILAMACGGWGGVVGIMASFFFMSIMFPTIFALGIRGLGDYTKFASSLLVMSIVGGAIMTPFMGHIADKGGMRVGFVIPLICFAVIAIYGALWQKLETKDSQAGG
ncbi:MAG TPA: sugar MFS transporter [Verrucomicrobiae bacterium]|nr:sugar MFS transporter [Verrucomicrobiae bacterium]